MKNKNTIQQLLEEKVVTTAGKVYDSQTISRKTVGITELRFEKPTKKSYDGKRLDWCVSDEYGQSPAFDPKEIQKQIKRLEVLEKIENYCSNNGILPEDLIKCHLETQQGLKKGKRQNGLGKVNQNP